MLANLGVTSCGIMEVYGLSYDPSESYRLLIERYTKCSLAYRIVLFSDNLLADRAMGLMRVINDRKIGPCTATPYVYNPNSGNRITLCTWLPSEEFIKNCLFKPSLNYGARLHHYNPNPQETEGNLFKYPIMEDCHCDYCMNRRVLVEKKLKEKADLEAKGEVAPEAPQQQNTNWNVEQAPQPQANAIYGAPYHYGLGIPAPNPPLAPVYVYPYVIWP